MGPKKTDHKSKIEQAIAAAARRANGSDSDNDAQEMNQQQQQQQQQQPPVQNDPPAAVAIAKQKKQISFDPKSTNNKDNFSPIQESTVKHPSANNNNHNNNNNEKNLASTSKYPGHEVFPPVNEAWAYQPVNSGVASSYGGDDDIGGGGGGGNFNAPSQDLSGSGGSDSDDNLIGGGSVSGSSASSMSSNARRSKEIAARPMMLYLVCLILVPILFVCVYQGLNVGFALDTLKFMSDHELVIEHMLELSHDLEVQMILDSELIGLRNAYGVSGEVDSVAQLPAWVPELIRTDTQKVDENWLDVRSSLSSLLIEVSEGAGAIPAFHDRIIGLPEFVARAELAGKRGQGDRHREIVKFILTELSVMIAILQQDEHAKQFALEMADLQLMSRVNEHLSYIFAYYREIEFAYNKSFDLFRNNSNAGTRVGSTTSDCSEFASAQGRIDTLTSYLETGSGNERIISVITNFRTDGWPKLYDFFRPFIKCSFQNTSLVFSDTEIKTLFDAEVMKIEASQLSLLLSIVENEEVKHNALVEGMKIMAAVIACAIGVTILIIIQKNERKELLQIIDHAEKLQTAVRRFVPKNQLRMMGIRTVLQAEAGFSTEVSQGLVYNSIRNFAQVSEKMTRTELFDWLQMYIARMTFVVQQQRGYLDSVLGDSTFSVFPQAIDAVGVAILMQQETDHMNIDLTAQRETDLLRVSIGVHFAVIVAGVFGDDNRLTCTMVASDVNLCQRLNDLTRNFGNRIMLSRAVIDQIDVESFEVRSLGIVDTATDSNLEIYDLYQADPPVLKTFKNSCREDFETAVRLSRSENLEEKSMAKDIFDELMQESTELQIVDIALLKKVEELNRLVSGAGLKGAAQRTPSSSALPAGAEHSTTGASSRETTDVNGRAVDVTRVSLADADGERYEELLRKSSILREKRKNSLAKRSPGLQHLDLGEGGRLGTSITSPPSGSNAAIFPKNPAGPAPALNITNVQSHNTSNSSNRGGAGAGAASASNMMNTNNNNSQNESLVNTSSNNNSNNNNNRRGSHSSNPNNNNNGNESPAFLRIGSDFAARVQSFGMSSAGGEGDKRENLVKYMNNRH